MTLFKRCSTLFVAAALLSAAGCASTSNRESTGEYIDDASITTKVKTAIFNEPTLKVAQINVETLKNVVQLSGYVHSQTDIDKAGTVARAVKGVSRVRNDLLVK